MAEKRDSSKVIFFSAWWYFFNKTNHFICGTHGKSTHHRHGRLALEIAGADPLVILGTKVFLNGKEKHSSSGETIHFVFPQKIGFWFESCEYHESFLHIFLLLSLWRMLSQIILIFRKPGTIFFQHFEILFIVFQKMEFWLPISRNRIFVPFQRILGTKIDASQFVPEVSPLGVPGEHNRKNAANVLALANVLDIHPSPIRTALSQFRGTWRRFQKRESLIKK